MAKIPLDKLADTIGATLDETARAFTIATFNGVIRDTRVDTGRLKGNWQTTTGAPASGTIERLDPSGAAALAEVQRNVQSGKVNWITNNLPYAAVWNERDGIIAKNVARLQRNVKEAIAKGKQKR